MQNKPSVNRIAWLLFGILAGLAIAYVMPDKDIAASSTDRDTKFALATSTVSLANGTEGVFVLDFLTGQLRGGVLNEKSGKFNHAYMRNIAADFNVNPKAKPHYAIVTGQSRLTSRGRIQMAQAVIYIAELSSGKVLCYGFPYNLSHKGGPLPLILLDGFQFREAIGN